MSLPDSADLCEPNTTRTAVRRGHWLRGYAYRFIDLCSAAINESVLRAASQPPRDADL